MDRRRPARRTVLAAGALSLALSACSSSQQPASSSETGTSPTTVPSTSTSTASAPSGEWTLGLDSRPTRGVTDGRFAFVTTSGGGKFPPQLYAVDAASGELLAHHSASGLPYGLQISADGALWVAGTRHSDQPTGGGVTVYDGESLLSVGLVDVPGVALTVASVGAEIWVGSDDAVFVLDPDDLSLLRSVPVEGSVNQLVPLPDGSGVAAAVTSDSVTAAIVILDDAGATLRRTEVEAAGSIVMAAAPAALWVRAPVGTDSVLLRYGLPALTMTDTGVRTDSAGGGLVATADGDALLVDERGGTVTCLPPDGATPTQIPADDLSGVLADLGDGRALFATASGVTARTIDCPP